MFLATVTHSFSPRVLGMVIDDAIIGQRGDLLLPLTGMVLGLAFLRSLLLFLQNRLADWFGIQSVHAIRSGIYRALMRLPFTFYDRARTGDLMTRVTADVDAIRQWLSATLLGMLGLCMNLAVGLSMGISISWRLTLITGIGSPVLVFLVVRLGRRNRQVHKGIRQAVADLGAVLQEGINGVRTVKAYAREELQHARMDEKSRDFSDAHRGAARVWSAFFPLLELWAQSVAIIVLGCGGWLVIRGGLSLGELVAYLALQWQIMTPLWNVGGHLNSTSDARTAAERILELLTCREGVKDLPCAATLHRLQGHVRFEEVSFAYEVGCPVLDGITLDAPAGSVIGIMGVTGSGKSTLVNLIPRFYDPTGGRVTVDGRDLRDVTLASLRSQIAVVFQETFLFSASVLDNIAFGRPGAALEEVMEAARLAQAHEFIKQLSHGYDTVVGERGVGLSGGQKQRIAIARALLGGPCILILDDATAAVDAETEQEIQEALRSAMRGRTTFIVAHRVSAVRHADEIIVLQDGRIAERGTHQELLAQCGYYCRIYEAQVRQEGRKSVAEEVAGP